MYITNKLKRRWREFLYLPYSIYFNFYYLPIRQAFKLPILLYKPNLKKLSGQIKIDTNDGKICYGMIRLGFPMVSIYPNTGIMWENFGGTIIFHGRCAIGNCTFLSFGEKTTVEFGDDFVCTAGAKIISYKGLKIGRGTQFGWGVLCMDTNFHPLFDMVKKEYKRDSGSIEIGDNNWFAAECKIMHSVKTPERCIFGMGSILTRGAEMKSYCVMAGSPLHVIAENVMRD